jgi:hypothetical protein
MPVTPICNSTQQELANNTTNACHTNPQRYEQHSLWCTQYCRKMNVENFAKNICSGVSAGRNTCGAFALWLSLLNFLSILATNVDWTMLDYCVWRITHVFGLSAYFPENSLQYTDPHLFTIKWCYFVLILTKLGSSLQMLAEIPTVTFQENLSTTSRVHPCGPTDRQT